VRDCEGGELHCVRGFIRSAGKCIQDEHLVQQVEIMKEKIRTFVCERKATLHCFGNALIAPFFLEKVEGNFISEIDLKNILQNSVYSQFEDVFAECVTLLARDMIPGVKSGGYSANGDQKWMCVDSPPTAPPSLSSSLLSLSSSSPPPLLSYSPLVCNVEGWVWEHVVFLAAVVVILMVFVFLMKKKRERAEDAVLLEEFLSEVSEILQTQAKQQDSQAQKWVAEKVMRDEIFHRYSYISRERNMRLWNKLVQIVERDNRIGKFPRMHQGEQCDTWQWAL